MTIDVDRIAHNCGAVSSSNSVGKTLGLLGLFAILELLAALSFYWQHLRMVMLQALNLKKQAWSLGMLGP